VLQVRILSGVLLHSKKKMGNYIQKRALLHEVKHEFSGKKHFFKVKSSSGQEYNIEVQANCDCEYMGIQGVVNSQICSHILAVFREVLINGTIRASSGNCDILQSKRNVCRNLVRRANQRVNEIRESIGESKLHRDKKREICEQLLLDGKQFITEAIFEDGILRADILVLDDFKVIEIAVTESEKSLEKKREYFKNLGLKMDVIRC